jgi:hypothetical protein
MVVDSLIAGLKLDVASHVAFALSQFSDPLSLSMFALVVVSKKKLVHRRSHVSPFIMQRNERAIGEIFHRWPKNVPSTEWHRAAGRKTAIENVAAVLLIVALVRERPSRDR